MVIVPALLEENREVFKEKLEKLVEFATRIQIDFDDGSFGGTVSLKPQDIKDLVIGPSALPGAGSLELEAHLMVQLPSKNGWIAELVNLNFKKIIIQYEIEDDIRLVLEEIKSSGVKAGLAIGPATSAFEVEPFADLLDTVTVLDVEPGKQGQKFLPEVLEKIKELKDGNFSGEVQADGAISDETIDDVVAVKPDTLVVGSYIVNSSGSHEAYSELVNRIAGE